MAGARYLLLAAVLAGGIAALALSKDTFLPHHAKATLRTHSAKEITKRYYDFLAFWEKELARDRINYIAAQNMARFHLAIGKATGDEMHYRQAEAILKDALAITPKNDFSTEALLARAGMTQHKFREAFDTAQKLLEKEPESKSFLQLRADAALGMGDYDTAFPDIEALLSRSPGYSSDTRAAQMRELQGRNDEAIVLYERALKAYDGDDADPIAWVYVQMGQNRLKAEDLSGAENYLNEALERSPDYGPAFSPLAKIAEQRGDSERAKSWLTRAIEFNPEPAVFQRMSQLELKAGNHTAAAELSDEALRRASIRAADNTGGHLRELAETLLDRNEDLPRALELAEKDLTYRAGDIRSNYVAAKAYRLNGDVEKAKEHMVKAMRFGTRDPEFAAEAAAES